MHRRKAKLCHRAERPFPKKDLLRLAEGRFTYGPEDKELLFSLLDFYRHYVEVEGFNCTPEELKLIKYLARFAACWQHRHEQEGIDQKNWGAVDPKQVEEHLRAVQEEKDQQEAKQQIRTGVDQKKKAERQRKLVIAAGVFFLGFMTSVPALVLAAIDRRPPAQTRKTGGVIKPNQAQVQQAPKNSKPGVILPPRR